VIEKLPQAGEAESANDSSAAPLDLLHVDPRLDRVFFYAGWSGPARGVLRSTFRAVRTGDFELPALWAESLHDRSLRSQSGAGRIRVVGR
jgi:uncharacterized protein YfaS (alpha-2-macroglobulin family)